MTLKWQLDARQHPAWEHFTQFMRESSRDRKGHVWGCEYRRWDWDLFKRGWESKSIELLKESCV